MKNFLEFRTGEGKYDVIYIQLDKIIWVRQVNSTMTRIKMIGQECYVDVIGNAADIMRQISEVGA